MNAEDICGEPTDSGGLCKLKAGWGRDEDSGPCKWHADTKPVPQKLTEQLIADMEGDLVQGHSVRASCGNNGISEDTHYRWLRLADDVPDDETSERAELLSEYSERVTRAEEAGDHYIEQHIVDIAIENNDPGALLRYLQEKRGGEASQDSEDRGPLALIPSDEQIAEMVADE